MIKRVFIGIIVTLLSLGMTYPATISGELPYSASILITGYTNINKFELNYSCTRPEVTALFNLAVEKNKLSGSFVIPLNSFSSKPEKVRDDFLDLTNASRYPYITIKLLKEISLEDELTGSGLPVSISMAGCSNIYTINCRITKMDRDHFVLDGNQTVRLTDYGISPPVKMVGLIKVENDLNINFSIIFTVSE